MASRVTLTAIYEPVENGWTQARIREIPEVVTAAPTRKQAEAAVRDALLEYLATFSKPVDDEAVTGDRQEFHLTVA